MKSKILLVLAFAVAGVASASAAEPSVGRYVPTLIKFEDGRVILLITDTTNGITKAVLGNKPHAGGKSAESYFNYLNRSFEDVEDHKFVTGVLQPALSTK